MNLIKSKYIFNFIIKYSHHNIYGMIAIYIVNVNYIE